MQEQAVLEDHGLGWPLGEMIYKKVLEWHLNSMYFFKVLIDAGRLHPVDPQQRNSHQLQWKTRTHHHAR